MPRAALPTLRVGDAWDFRGVNATGAAFEETQRIVGLGTEGGVPAYLVNDTVGDTTQPLPMTRDGLDPVNATGYVTELLRFPLAVGANWTFGWSHRVAGTQNGTAWAASQSLRGVVEVAAYEKVHTLARPFDAFRLEANLTSTIGAFQRTLHITYWYAPELQNFARLEETQDGVTSWSEVVSWDLGPGA